MPKLHTVTPAELRRSMTEAENAAVSRVVDGELELEAWLGEFIAQAADRVVGAINACEKNARIATGLCRVPAECVRVVIVLARHAAIAAVPGMADALEGSTRAAEYATATRDLDRLAACELLPLYELAEEEQADDSLGRVSVISHPVSDWMI